MDLYKKNLNKIMIHFREFERKFATFFFGPSERTVEYSFILRNIPYIKGLKILEIGCTGSTLSYKLAQMGFKVVAVDLRSYPFTHRNLNFILGDILQLDLPIKYFDVVIMVSTIEHIGMGGYDDDINLDGDILMMKKVVDSVKLNGQILLTFPINPFYKEISFYERYYDFSRIKRLIGDLNIAIEEYYIPTRNIANYSFNWIKASKKEILDQTYLKFYPHATACLKLIKKIN